MKGSEAKKLKGQDKDSHLAPTKIDDYYNPIKATERTHNLSDKEVQDKLNVLSRASNRTDRFFAIQKLIEKHKSEVGKLNDNRIKQDINYASGQRKGLQQVRHEIIKEDRVWLDQDKNNKVLKIGKEEYDKNGLKKTFSHEKMGMRHDFNIKKDKDIDMDMER